MRATASVFAPKIHHTVANITMRLSLLCCRIWLKPVKKIVLWLFNLIQLAIDSPWTNFYIYISLFYVAVGKQKCRR